MGISQICVVSTMDENMFLSSGTGRSISVYFESIHAICNHSSIHVLWLVFKSGRIYKTWFVACILEFKLLIVNDL